MLIDGIYYPIFCAKTGELVLDQDEIEVTSINSGAFREYIPGLNSGTFTATGITELDNTAGHISVTYLMQQAIRRVIQSLKTQLTDDDGNVLLITYNAFVTNTTLSKQTGSYSQSAVTMRLTGGMTFSTIIPPPVIITCEVQTPLYLTLAEGDLTVSDALLLNPQAQILALAREGLQYSEVVSSPGGREFTYDNTTGVITFSVPGNPGGEGIDILYQILL